jgi:predicted GH43/DUF377 family glycosyl hydrolase
MKISLFLCLLVLLATLGSTLPKGHASLQGQVALDLGQGWDSRYVDSPCVIYTGSSYMMWYSGTNGTGFDNIGLATSSDGISWQRYSGNPVFNVSQIGWDSHSVNAAWVMYEDGVYKMWYSGQYGTNGQLTIDEIGYATSSDGIHWIRSSKDPVLTPGALGSWDDKFVWSPIVIHHGSFYTMYYTGANTTNAVGNGVATSSDGLHWAKTGKMANNWYSEGVAIVRGVTEVNGVFLAFYFTFPNPQIGMASSVDGVSWTVYDGNPLITTGSSGSWDDAAVHNPMMLDVSNQYFVYFTGDNKLGEGRIGLAILPAIPVPEFSSSNSLLFTILSISSVWIVASSLRKKYHKC